jgi:hypothetical protein
MPTPASQVELTLFEDQLGELILLDAPGAQISALSDQTPLPIGTESAGTASAASRADHIHRHGNQTGGSLHLGATSGAAGFMSSADKAKLDAATDVDTASTLVLRDSAGDFAANEITADLIGNVTGDLTGTASDIADNTVTSAKIVDGAIVDADVNAAASIAVSKLADGAARQLLQTDAAGNGVEWASNIDIPGTLDVTGVATFDDNVVIDGDLTVNGTETIINTETLEVEDKNIVIGKVNTPTDTTADGGGITLKGATDKTLNWVDATDAWTLSEHVDLASAKEYRIAGTKVLDATSLGSAVVSSSLTSVGTIATGTWEGDAIDAAYLDATVVTTDDTGTVTSTMISDGTIVDGDINASAAIAGTKIDPDFGSQTVETTGVFSAAGGAEATPSITFTGDLNTGIYSPGADQVAISTNGSEKLLVDSDGNVVISNNANYRGKDSGGVARNLLRIDASNNTVIGTAAASNRIFIAGTGTGEALRIDSSGRLGLGTSAPAELLEVVGASPTDVDANYSLFRGPGSAQPGVYIGGNSTTASTGATARYGYIRSQSSSGTARALYLQTGADTRVVIDNTGKVGIGTTSPAQALEVSASNASIRITDSDTTAATSTSYLEFSGSDARSAVVFTDSAGITVQADAAGGNAVRFNTNGSNERARIDSSGRLLMGTSVAYVAGGNISSRLQLHGLDASNSSWQTTRWSANNSSPFNSIQKSRGASVGTRGIVLNGDDLGFLNFAGDDGTDFINAARIQAQVDGTPNTAAMPGRLIFSTTADGASGPIERMRIDSAGFISLGGNTNTGFSNPSADNLAITTGGSERARIDSSGRLLVGTSTARTNLNSTDAPSIQLEGTNYNTSTFSVIRNSANTASPNFVLAKSRNASVGGNTAVLSGDVLGVTEFQGNDGTNFIRAATITAAVDGTPSANDMPGRLVFSVTLDGASSPTEALRITNDRVVAYNQAAPVAVNTSATITADNLKAGIITSTTAAAVTMTLPTGTNIEAGFSGIYTNFTFEFSVINTGPNTLTVGANGNTTVGSLTVATLTSARYALRRTGANAFTLYRLS